MKALHVVVAATASGMRAGPGAFTFGAMTGITFAVTSILLLAFRSGVLWVLVAVLQMLVIVGYVVVSTVRTPPFELWGLLIKTCQVVILVAVGYPLVGGSRSKRA